MYRIALIMLFTAASIWLDADAGWAGQCDRCGCQSCCQKVCRVVCEMKEVKETCYSCKCEEFCVPGRSEKCGEVCECDPCKRGSGCTWLDCLLGQRHCESCRNVWKPSCEVELRCRNRLYKTEIVKKVPTYKWVVEYCCPDCCATAEGKSEPTAGDMEEPDQPVSVPQEMTTPYTAHRDEKHDPSKQPFDRQRNNTIVK